MKSPFKQTAQERYVLRLYVTGMTPRSIQGHRKYQEAL